MRAFSTITSLLVALNAFAAGGTIGSGVTISASGTATDLKYANPRWVDAKAEGTSIALGANAPTLRDVPGNWTTGFESQAYAYAVNDYGSFNIQAGHVFASTNGGFQNFYYEPHIHISSQTIAVGATNVTFVIQWQTAPVFGSYSNSPTLTRTNTHGFDINTPIQHALLSFGNITNNDLQERSSVCFRGTVRRITSASNDVGIATGQEPFVDSIDFHTPVRVYGSKTQYTEE